MVSIATILGFSKEDVERYRAKNPGQICSNWYSYRDGLRRKRELEMAALIINIAIANKVRIIAMEDIDNKNSSYNSKEENKTNK